MPAVLSIDGLRSLVWLIGVYAVVDIPGVKFARPLGALAWRGLYELGRNLNRVQVLFAWITDLFFRAQHLQALRGL